MVVASRLSRSSSGAPRTGSSRRLLTIFVTVVVTMMVDSVLRSGIPGVPDHRRDRDLVERSGVGSSGGTLSVTGTTATSTAGANGAGTTSSGGDSATDQAANGTAANGASSAGSAAALSGSGGFGGAGESEAVDPYWGDAPRASSSPHWELPEEWRSKIVTAVPMSPSSWGWVEVSRLWRRGIRAALVADFQPTAKQILDAGEHAETFVPINVTDVPYSYYGKAAMVPSVAHEYFGESNYGWMLYGDDDTIWHLDAVVDIVKGLDPNLPHMITDHFWFWGHGGGTPPYPEHPSPAAPRCVPCGHNVTNLARESGFVPPQACPFCTWEMLCKADSGRRSIYGPDCKFQPRYPPQGELLAHGGAGIILSVGLMRMLPASYMRECISTRFGKVKVPGGDTLFSHCVFFTGVAPTDPGYFFRDGEFNAFDQGGQLVRQSWDLAYHSLKRGCCSAQCRARLAAATTVHMRSLHFKEPEAAMDVARMLVRMREIYLRVRDQALVHPNHDDVPRVWDLHKVCY